MTALVEAAEVIGGYAWLEERLFEVLGGWVPAVPEPEIKLRLAADSHHHAWHASLWRERLPELAELATESFVRPAGPAPVEFVATLATSPTTIDKLVGLYRVALPRLVAAYSRHLAGASPITDGPTIRALNLVLVDELTDWREGELLIQAHLGDVAGVERAAAHQARLEALFLDGAGGARGPA